MGSEQTKEMLFWTKEEYLKFIDAMMDKPMLLSLIHIFKVHTAYIAEVKRDLGLPMYDAPNAVEELKQPRTVSYTHLDVYKRQGKKFTNPQRTSNFQTFQRTTHIDRKSVV